MTNVNLKILSVGYLGPEGTFTEQALKKIINGSKFKFIPYLTIKNVIEGVAQGELNLGFVPLENSIEGSVNETLDMLLQNASIRIIRESVMPIRHNLITPIGMDLNQVKEVYSHPQAIAQCRNNLYKILPHSKIIFTNSTSEAIGIIREKGGNLAAIGSESGLRDNLEVKLYDIQDYPNNQTRFILISNERERMDLFLNCPEKKYKTSIGFTLSDKPGALYELLKIFAENKVNLKKIESRPTKNKLGEYIFFMDIEGTETNFTIKKTLTNVERITENFKNLGSYIYDERSVNDEQCGGS